MIVSPIYYTLLCIQSGLSNNVVPQLRAVTLLLNEKKHSITPHFFYDCEITEESIEQVWDILEEVDSPGEYNCFPEEVLQLRYPQKIPIQGNFAYLRYEKVLPELKRENRSFLLKQEDFPPQAVYRLDMQEALLGKVTPTLRYVSVGIDIDLKKLTSHFVYDGAISEFDYNLATRAIEESKISFPDYQMDALIERVDFPNPFKPRGKWLAFFRHEYKYGE